MGRERPGIYFEAVISMFGKNDGIGYGRKNVLRVVAG
jgi:hypothetical protein